MATVDLAYDGVHPGPWEFDSGFISVAPGTSVFYQVWFYFSLFVPPPTTAINPSNLEDGAGAYHRVFIDGGNVYYARADLTAPPFDLTQQVTDSEGDTYPCIGREASGRLLLFFQRGEDAAANVLKTTSDDDGASWSDPEVSIPGGSKPRVAVGTDGTILTLAKVGDHLQATRQDPGAEAPTPPYTVVDETASPIEVEDDTFDFDQAGSGDWPWVLVYVPLGGTTPVEAQSFDEMVSVKLV